MSADVLTDVSHWMCGSGYVELQIKFDDAKDVARSGRNDDDVLALSKVPHIANQLAGIDPEKLRKTLDEFGAWDDKELSDHDQNLQRILWIACWDVVEGNV